MCAFINMHQTHFFPHLLLLGFLQLPPLYLLPDGCSKRGLLGDLVVKGVVLLKKTCLLDLSDELESHGQLPKIRVPLELPDVVHGEPDQHVESHKSNADDKGEEKRNI